MLVDSMLVTTVAVTDLDQAKAFYRDQVGLQLLDEQPFAIRFGAGKGTQVSVRRGQPNVGQTVGHFEVDDIEAVVRELTGRGRGVPGIRDAQDGRLHRPDRACPRRLVQRSRRQRLRRAPGPGARGEIGRSAAQLYSLKRSSFQGSASLL